MNRFTVPKYIKKHLPEHRTIESLSRQEIDSIRNGIARFNIENPIVSIVIPVWNEEKAIITTLSSFSAMEIKYPSELIIVNNHSTDKTQEILDFFGVRSISEQKKGVSFARQTGLFAAKGKYLLSADGDSIYPPKWISALVTELENEKVACVYGKHSFLPCKGAPRLYLAFHEMLAELLFALRNKHRKYLNVGGFNFGFRIEQAKSLGGWNLEKNIGEDGWMALHLMENFGSIQKARHSHGRGWTTARRLLADGSVWNALYKRIKKESRRLKEYFFKVPINK